MGSVKLTRDYNSLVKFEYLFKCHPASKNFYNSSVINAFQLKDPCRVSESTENINHMISRHFISFMCFFVSGIYTNSITKGGYTCGMIIQCAHHKLESFGFTNSWHFMLIKHITLFKWDTITPPWLSRIPRGTFIKQNIKSFPAGYPR